MSGFDLTPDPVSLQDRFRGLMVGTAVGDACGRPIEGHRVVPDSYLDEIRNDFTMVQYTDDTILTMALSESLLACDGFSGEDMADRLVDAWREEPRRGYGAGVTDWFSKVLQGKPWDKAAKAQFGGSGSYGNGGAMRVAPVAMWARDLDETVHLARETAKVTHTHPIGVEGALIQAVAAHHALKPEFDPARLIADLDDLVETEEFRKKLDILPSCLERDNDERARLHLGNWVAADNSVVTALYCFLLADDFEDAIIRAIRMGGDTDTIGAMAGALAGARWGLSAIPDAWHAVEAYDRLVGLADRMFERV